MRGLVYETMDGGGLPGRVVCAIDATDQVLVRLDPALSPLRTIRDVNPDRFRHRGYVVFKRASLTEISA